MTIVGTREATEWTHTAILEDKEVEAIKISVQLKEGVTKPSATMLERATLLWLAGHITPWTEFQRQEAAREARQEAGA